jgi:hypothetical protein
MNIHMYRKYLISTGKFKKSVVNLMKPNQVIAIWYRLTGEASVPKFRR